MKDYVDFGGSRMHSSEVALTGGDDAPNDRGGNSMKVRVVISYNFSEEERRAINAYFGEPGMADRETLKSLIESNGDPRDTGHWAEIFNSALDGDNV